MTIATENLSKRFNREWIFRGFTFAFPPGHYAIIGPNGSGKSTLLQVLWGQLPSTSGAIRYELEGVLVPQEQVFRHVSIVAPYVDLMEELTLAEILHFHFSFKKSRENRTIPELMDLMELTYARDKQVGHFSSGMKQRLKLGLALFSEVQLLFLDEPTMNLDKAAIGWYWRNFRLLPPETTVLIGSNHEAEYPSEAIKISMADYKGLQINPRPH
ncbi:MAG: ABC transporter ATP-binding protein [Cyclobacteriaceae bacterium]|nr:ABC transporter ATP-binding protein [Cyclobacteriaceae bacterium]